jgi:hypothetical protein
VRTDVGTDSFATIIRDSVVIVLDEDESERRVQIATDTKTDTKGVKKGIVGL